MARFLVGYNAKGKAVLAASAYPYVDLRKDLPGNPQPSQGVGPKPLGSVNHWNGPKVLLSDLDQLWVDARYHMEKNWGSASHPAYTNGVQYEMGIGHDGTKYRLRNPGAKLWHCGNPDYNDGAFSNTFLIGEGQYPTAAALESMAELNAAQLELVGLSDDYCFGHLDIRNSSCPGTAYNGFVVPFRKGERFASAPEPPQKSTPQPKTDNIQWINYVYSPGDNWGLKVAGAMAEGGFAAGLRGGLTKRAAKAAADARDTPGVYTFIVGDKAVARAKRYQHEFTNKDIAYNHGGSVRVVEASYRDHALWRLGPFLDEKDLADRRAAATESFEREMAA